MTELVLRADTEPVPGVRFRRAAGEAPKAVRIALYAFIATLPFEAVPIAEALTGRFSLARIAGYLFFLVAILNAGIVLRPPRTAVKWFVVWVAILAIWIPFQPADLRSASLRHVTQLVQMLVLMWTASNVLRSNRAWRGALVVLVCSCALLAAYMTFFPPQFGDERSTALGENPNTVGTAFALATIGAIGLFGQIIRGPSRFFFAPLAAVLLVQLVATGSRGAMVALLCGVAAMMLRSRGIGGKAKAIVITLPIVAALLWVAVTSDSMRDRLLQAINEQRFAKREQIVPLALEMIGERPLLGWGPERHLRELGYRMHRDSMDEHNLYLWVLNEGGAIAFMPFIFGAILALRDADRGRYAGRGSILIALVITLAAANMAHSHHNRKISWLVLAMAVSTPSIARNTRGSRVRPRPAERVAGVTA